MHQTRRMMTPKQELRRASNVHTPSER